MIDCDCSFIEYCRKAEKSTAEEQHRMLDEMLDRLDKGDFRGTEDLAYCGIKIILALHRLGRMVKE